MWTIAGWVIVGVLALLAASPLATTSGHATLAVAQDATVYVLTLAWVVLVVALLGRSWVLAGAAGLLVGYQIGLVMPRITRNRVPRWVRSAPRLELVVVNVFIDNKTPGVLARELLARGGDAILILEWNAGFLREFDAAGGQDQYPHRLFDPENVSDYAVGIVSKQPLLPESEMKPVGPLTLAQAVVDLDGARLTLLGVNPMAAVDPGGFDEWERQIDALIAYLPSVATPFVVAGDLNTTTYRPKVRELLATGLVDAHESLGQGLSASFKLSADGALAAPGAVVRLDHAFLSDGIRALTVEDLASGGSDHVPFVVTLAVRPPQHGSAPSRGRRPATRSTSARRSG